jgi:hypothetical protein
MARFPHYKRNVQEIGRLLARASMDADFRAKLIASPAETLSEIGLPNETTSLISFKVVEQSNSRNAVVLPYRLSDEKLRNKDVDYVQNLGRSFALN